MLDRKFWRDPGLWRLPDGNFVPTDMVVLEGVVGGVIAGVWLGMVENMSILSGFGSLAVAINAMRGPLELIVGTEAVLTAFLALNAQALKMHYLVSRRAGSTGSMNLSDIREDLPEGWGRWFVSERGLRNFATRVARRRRS